MSRISSLYIAFDAFPLAKGSSSHIASMVQGLARNFGSVRLLCLGRPDMPGYQREGPIEIYRFRQSHRNLLQRATAFARFVEAHVRRLAGQLQLAVFRDPWGGYPLLDANPGCPALFEVNALPTWELQYSLPDFAPGTALAAKIGDIERRCLRDSTRILCVSSVTRRALVRAGTDEARIDVIPNVAHDVFFAPPASASPIPQLESGDWFGYFGSLHSWQGIDSLIDAFALVAPDLPTARLLILHGDTRRPLRDLEKRIARHGLADRVLVHPPVPQDQVASILARLKFSAVPLADTPRNTVQGCCPIKLVESLAAGTPVIASDLAVCREWIAHEREGLLAQPGDTRAWALAIHRLFRDGDLRRRLAFSASRRAREQFSWSAVHRQLDRTFQMTAAKLSAGVPV